MTRALAVLAGPGALAHLRTRGFRWDDVRVMPAASGGPKWLSIAGLDRVLADEFFPVPARRPVDLIGSSIGSWRIAALTQRDPRAALARGHAAYVHEQEYTPRPTAVEVSAVLASALDRLLGAHGAAEMVQHPWARAHVVTARGRGLTATRQRATLAAGLGVAAATNALTRRSLSVHFQRVIFAAQPAVSPFGTLRDLPTRLDALTAENARAVLLASGSIPLVMDGVTIPGDATGIHWDGGVTDYHLPLRYDAADGLVLYPHFYPHLVPGWFDKSLPWRRAPAAALDRVLLLAPSAEWVATLPGGRIPDRKDFYRYPSAERIRHWERVLAESERLGDELRTLLATERLAEVVRPL